MRIKINFHKGFFVNHFKTDCGTVIDMDKLTYIYKEDGKPFLCLTTFGYNNDGQAINKTKTIELYDFDLNEVEIEGSYFVRIKTEGNEK